MPRLTGRVKAIERKAGVGGPCRRCQGRGSSEVLLVDETKEDPDSVKPKGCPECGAVGLVKMIILGADEGVPSDGAST